MTIPVDSIWFYEKKKKGLQADKRTNKPIVNVEWMAMVKVNGRTAQWTELSVWNKQQKKKRTGQKTFPCHWVKSESRSKEPSNSELSSIFHPIKMCIVFFS